MPANKDHIGEVIEYSIEHGDKQTCEAFQINQESLNRYKREYKKYFGDNAKLFLKLRKQFSKEELEALSKKPPILSKIGTSYYSFDGEDIIFGAISDSHIGSQYTNEKFLLSAIEEFKRQNCAFVVHAGDVTEGMSGRDGHVYELSHIGYREQKKASINLLGEWKKKWYMVAGNHDCWYLKKADTGADIVEDICQSLPDAEYLGIHEGDIHINGAMIKVWHGEDGSSFSHSYRIQHLLGSLSPNEVPDVLLTGHVHKLGYFYERNCHALSLGAIQEQSGFMRYKRLPSHVGFSIIRMRVKDSRVVSFSPTWYPLEQ